MTAARQQAVLVVAEHGARCGAVDRCAEPEQPQFDVAIPEQGAESRQGGGTSWGRPAQEQQVEITIRLRCSHRRHAAELKVHRLVSPTPDRVDPLGVDVDDERSVARDALHTWALRSPAAQVNDRQACVPESIIGRICLRSP